ncbi:spermatogenesis-associated protein 4 isoform X2 [Nerophis lumbriciformis]|uniref:spermatogenesis-associated protein 4 isoform X2 n=1 Tax=Nerophis lumbriciformis TaxID=546530 RepID=UPI002ADFD4C4|nr:spermatogenesis-associated protein 4-like isoform X2 [Nerophis lumbriciformis]
MAAESRAVRAGHEHPQSLQRLRLLLMDKMVYGTIHCKAGAAELLVQHVYTILTKNRIRAVQNPDMDFSDQKYQKLLPWVARPTALTAVNSNVRATEMKALPDLYSNQRRAEAIISKHLEEKAEKLAERGRLIKMRRVQTTSSGDEKYSSGENTPKLYPQSPLDGAVVSYKTITVNQPARRSLHS